jgi:CRISPR-associated exonuclease Cas4
MDKKTTDGYLRINEIKNHIYCPRIPFYALCLRLDRETALSRLGIEREGQVKQKMKRRKHALHAVHPGERHFDVPITVERLRLVGHLDELVETPDGVYLVDYKDTDRDYGYWKVQMLAYRLGIEALGHRVLGCYIYTIPDQTYHPVKLTRREENRLETIVTALHELVEREVCPPPTPHSRKCLTCQYVRFCNDVT